MGILRPVWAEVDLGALRRNYRRIKEYTSSEIMPIVKADAYGHGAVEVVRALKNEGIKRVGVAFLEEALELKNHFPDLSYMVIGPTLPKYSMMLVEEDIIPEIFQVEQAEALSRAAIQLGKTAKLHVKVDTGMGRIGFRKETAIEDIERIGDLPGIFIEGIYTHLATADSTDLSYARKQIQLFEEIYDNLQKKGIYIPIRHAANSAAVMQLPEAGYELCRSGLILYGLLPMDHAGKEAGFEPALSLKARISHVKTIQKGDSVSYGRSFIAAKPTKVATLPLGYADGVRRDLSNGGQVLLKGKRVMIIGKVCMDHTMLDVTELEDIWVGDEVTFIGEDGQDNITADEIAKYLKTISYEIICGISKRVPRVYIES